MSFDPVALAAALGVTPDAARAAVRQSAQGPRKRRDRVSRPAPPRTPSRVPQPRAPKPPAERTRWVIACTVCGAWHRHRSGVPAVVLCDDCTPRGIARRKRIRRRRAASAA